MSLAEQLEGVNPHGVLAAVHIIGLHFKTRRFNQDIALMLSRQPTVCGGSSSGESSSLFIWRPVSLLCTHTQGFPRRVIKDLADRQNVLAAHNLPLLGTACSAIQRRTSGTEMQPLTTSFGP